MFDTVVKKCITQPFYKCLVEYLLSRRRSKSFPLAYAGGSVTHEYHLTTPFKLIL